MDRRQFILAATVSGASIACLSACGGGGGSSSQAAEAIDLLQWYVVPSPVLIAGETTTVVDLAGTLPPGVRRGGRFRVSSIGSPLPTGVVLSGDGVLSLTSAATVGVTQGVVFSYEEPTP